MKDVIDYVSSENPDAQMFRDPDFLSAIIGYTLNTDGLPVLVYDYDKMVESLATEYTDSDDAEADAIDFIWHNTIRSLPYFGKNAPIIIYSFE